jgi:phenylacetate-CoA ligase
MDWRFQSWVPGIAWPAIPDYGRAAVLALLHQIEQSQWLPAERVLAGQLAQLAALVRHAAETVPFYRESWAGRHDASPPDSYEAFARLPFLSRAALQANYESLKSRNTPQAHGQVSEVLSTGSTGMPVRVLTTDVMRLFWNALALRDHLWHRRKLDRTLAVVRGGVVASEAANWGPATDGLVVTGRTLSLGLDADVDTQLEWLGRHDPAYLLTYPSNLAQLARTSLRRGLRLPGLIEARTLSEALEPGLRDLCKEAWGVPLVDLYSAREVGYIALQCPEHEHYHVQSESLLVEILNDAGRPCAPGEVGRVVITDLHNFATPLIRYDIGDYAEVGEACSCGRSLPVLKRIVGRIRNMLVTAGGKRYWPTFGQRTFAKIAPVLQHQFVQKTVDLVEARLVVPGALTTEQEQRLQAHIASNLPSGIRVVVVRVDSIPRGAGGKFEDFVCEVAPQP